MFCSSSLSCFLTERLLSGQRSDSGTVIWWRHLHDSAAAASVQRILILCLAFWCIFDMQKGIPALKNLTNYFNLFSTTDRGAGILRTDVSGFCVSAVCGDEERGMTSGVQNQRELETEVMFQQWDSRCERWTPNPVSVFKTTPAWLRDPVTPLMRPCCCIWSSDSDFSKWILSLNPHPSSSPRSRHMLCPPILLICPVWNARWIDYFNVQFFDPLLFVLMPLGYTVVIGLPLIEHVLLEQRSDAQTVI